MRDLLNKVTQGDCLEVMRDISDKSIDMILCDLPYGTTACKWDTVIPFDELWGQYERIINDNGAIVLTASQPFTSALVMSNPKLFRHQWVWDKKVSASFALCNVAPMKVHEDILVFSKKKVTYNPVMTPKDKPRTDKHKQKQFETAPLQKRFDEPVTYTKSYPKSIIEVSNRSEKRGLHPTQKPVALFEYLIKTYSSEGDIILDNCMGSGTTAVAAINTGRKFIGIEREPNYVEIANKRINDAIDKRL